MTKIGQDAPEGRIWFLQATPAWASNEEISEYCRFCSRSWQESLAQRDAMIAKLVAEGWSLFSKNNKLANLNRGTENMWLELVLDDEPQPTPGEKMAASEARRIADEAFCEASMCPECSEFRELCSCGYAERAAEAKATIITVETGEEVAKMAGYEACRAAWAKVQGICGRRPTPGRKDKARYGSLWISFLQGWAKYTAEKADADARW